MRWLKRLLGWAEPQPIARDQHFKGGIYHRYQETIYQGTKPVLDYDKVSLIKVRGRYTVVDYDRHLIPATVQAKLSICPGDEVQIYMGVDHKQFWIRSVEEYNEKFTELERY